MQGFKPIGLSLAETIRDSQASTAAPANPTAHSSNAAVIDKMQDTIQTLVTGSQSETPTTGTPDQLCLNSNLNNDHPNIGVTGDGTMGHSWVTVKDGESVDTGYGLWPDSQQEIQDQGLDNGEGSDIRENFEIDATVGAHEYCEDVTPEQVAQLEEIIETGDTYGAVTNNCAGWASEVFAEITGTDISNRDWGYAGVKTPPQTGTAIDDLNASQKA